MPSGLSLSSHLPDPTYQTDPTYPTNPLPRGFPGERRRDRGKAAFGSGGWFATMG